MTGVSALLIGVLVALELQSPRPALLGVRLGLLLGLLVWVSCLNRRSLRQRTAAQAHAKEAHRSRERFLANMSHELRTPVNGMLGIIALLLEEGLSPRHAAMLQDAQRSGRTLNAQVDELLNFAELQAGLLSISPAPFEPSTAVWSVVAGFQDRCAKKGLELSLTVRAGADGWATADRERFRQALARLIDNAVKFTSTGQIRVILSRSGSALWVSIVDSGEGIPAEKQSAILEAFTQADPSSTRRFGGTGLGLTFARHLIEMMGGAVALRSKPGVGSCFRFSIDAPPCPAPPSQPLGTVRPLRVLIAEDNHLNLLITQKMLARLGHDSHPVEDGLAAISALREGAFDLILMDCDMPIMDGLEATRQIRTQKAGLPIIALTASSSPVTRQAAMDAGVTDYLCKPTTLERLNESIQRAVQPRQPVQEISAPRS